MGKYKLAAFDMDGTLLNSKKEISPATLAALKKAAASGKYIALSTGRCLPELYKYFKEVPELRYAICVSGGMVYDAQTKSFIYENALSPEICLKLFDALKDKDVMPHMLTELSTVQRSHAENMENYSMAIYKEMFLRVGTLVDNIYDYYKSNPIPLHKLNFYHRSPEDREDSRRIVEALGLPIEIVYAEKASLECSALGVTKGRGIEELAKHLGISVEETIMVGDAPNDIAGLKTAGLSVAMGNALPEIKAICDVTVSDCDHDGCAEVIEKYLLN